MYRKGKLRSFASITSEAFAGCWF